MQLYTAPPERSGFAEARRLAAFASVNLAPGERKRVRMRLDETSFRFWDVFEHRWRIEAGEYEASFCASSRDARLAAAGTLTTGSGPFSIDERRVDSNAVHDVPACYERVAPGCFTDAAFVRLMGPAMPARRPLRPFTIDSPVSDMSSTFIGRQAFRVVDMLMAKTVARMSPETRAMMSEMAADMPLRSFTSGGVPLEAVEGLVDVLNGRRIAGMAKIVRYLPSWGMDAN